MFGAIRYLSTTCRRALRESSWVGSFNDSFGAWDRRYQGYYKSLYRFAPSHRLNKVYTIDFLDSDLEQETNILP